MYMHTSCPHADNTSMSCHMQYLHTMLSQLPLGASSESPLADRPPTPPETKGTQSGVLCGPCTWTLLHLQQPGSRSGVQGTGFLMVSFSCLFLLPHYMFSVNMHIGICGYIHVLEWSVSISACIMATAININKMLLP